MARRKGEHIAEQDRGMTTTVEEWTNHSVRKFAGRQDPIAAMARHARAVVLEAMDAGWSGPPYDPIELARIRGVPVRPVDHVVDARTVPTGTGFRIEYKPTRPRARSRYSIAHEIAHTFFEDCADTIRYRRASRKTPSDEWQLEVLCNIGAAEILMPIAALRRSDLSQMQLKIDRVLALRKKFAVSTEAILIRLAQLADFRGGAFAAACTQTGADRGRYRLDYVVPSNAWQGRRTRALLPEETLLRACTAIGYTTKTEEVWPIASGRLHVEAVAVPPYPGLQRPRVVGLFYEHDESADQAMFSDIKYVRGDALDPQADGHRIVAHIVNDKTPRWGGGFAKEVKRRYPFVQNDFIDWQLHTPHSLQLGNTRHSEANSTLSVFNMVAQRGYGPSVKPRVRYKALSQCLIELAAVAARLDATVHMPRIGVGQGGGSWDVVSDLIRSILVRRRIPVTVYDLPGSPIPDSGQAAFQF